MNFPINYLTMCKEAKEQLDTLWVPDIGDFAVCSNGMLGVITNRDKQEVMYPDQTKGMAYVGVAYHHNGKLWSSRNPIWLPRLDQIVNLSLPIISDESDLVLALQNLMIIKFGLVWSPELQKWQLVTQ